MPNTWIVVADSGSARIFNAESPTGALVEREDYANPEARISERSLTSDRPGRTVDSSGRSHAYSSDESPREAESRAFAKLLADRLSGARAKGELDRLVLVAAPEFLGKLRAALDKETRKRVDGELSADLGSLTPKEIHERLVARLAPGASAH
jgi:protein required for attachment to host cells